jgi:adenosine deaminase
VPPGFDDAPAALILEAIDRLGARRIGHGTSLAGSTAARVVARQRGIGIECCPWSNDLMGFMPLDRHPLGQFLSDGLLVSLATDDPLMFGTFTVREVFDVTAPRIGLESEALRQMTRNAIDTAFVSDERREWLGRTMRRWAPGSTL